MNISTLTLASHGDLTEPIRVSTNWDKWRPIVLNVRVASFSDISLISPYGSNPNLISAWNPLQIPIIKPSLLSNKSLIAAFNLGFLKTVAINLPEPSGSSPTENPLVASQY